MSDIVAPAQKADLVLEYELDAPTDKVWRAISIPAFREKWLPGPEMAEAEPFASTPGKEICYRMRDGEPPFLESIVTLRLSPTAAGGTRLVIVHRLVDDRLQSHPPRAANNNGLCVMRAA